MKTQNENIKFKMNFDVPDGYFDKLADNVMANIKFQEKRRRRNRNIVLSICSAAASVFAIVATIGFMNQHSGSQDVAYSSYYQYYTDNIETTISDYGLMEMLDDQANYSQSAMDAGSYAELVYSEYSASPVNFSYFNN